MRGVLSAMSQWKGSFDVYNRNEGFASPAPRSVQGGYCHAWGWCRWVQQSMLPYFHVGESCHARRWEINHLVVMERVSRELGVW